MSRIILGTQPLIGAISIMLSGSCNLPLGNITISTCVILKNLSGWSQNIMAATFFTLKPSGVTSNRSIWSRTFFKLSPERSWSDKSLPTSTRKSLSNAVEISFKVIISLPRSSNGVRFARFINSRSYSSLGTILLLL